MTARLRPTWLPEQARRYRRPGGPWDVPTLDALLTTHGGEVVDGSTRLSAAEADALVAVVAGGLRARGVRPGPGRRLAGAQQPGGRRPDPGLLAHRRRGGSGPALVRRRRRDGGPRPDRPRAGAGDRGGRLFRPCGAGQCRRWGCPGAVRRPPQQALRRRAGPLHFGIDRGAQGGPAHPARPELEGVVDGPRARPRPGRRRPDARADGPHFGPAQRGPRAGCRRPALGAGAPFRPRTGAGTRRAERISFLAGPPTFFIAMARALAESPDTDVSSIRLVSSGGASVTPAFVEETARTFDCRVKRTYGSTEAPTVTTSTDDDPFEKARDTDGRAVGAVELRVSDPETGARCRTGTSGELWVRGPEMFAGYADAQQTATVIARGGWFRTGDLATVDAEGWVRIVGRLKDVIIRGGENISASEVEGALEAHPDIHHAVAVGAPDPLLGERVAAFVESAAPFDLEECRRWFASRGMAKFKTPEKVECLDRLPLLGSGKPDRAALQRRAAAI